MFYFRLYPAPEIFAGLNFRLIFASFKSGFEFFNYSPGSIFRLLKPLAKMAKIKAGQKTPLTVYACVPVCVHVFICIYMNKFIY